MTITKIRLQEQHPIVAGGLARPLPPVDLYLTAEAGRNGYLIKDIVGLGPPSLSAIVVGFDAVGTPILESSALSGREIALKIGFNPTTGQSVDHLRTDLYKLISRSLLVTLMNDSIVIGTVAGYIGIFDVNHFTNQPDIQMTILCKIGDFEGPKEMTVPVSSIAASPVINYIEGDAPAGMKFSFVVTTNAASWRIYNHATSWYSGASTPVNEFRITYPMLVGDIVTVNTQPGVRSILLQRGVTTYDIAGSLNAGAVWPMLQSGVNGFDWDLTSAWMTLTYFKYTPRFWGI